MPRTSSAQLLQEATNLGVEQDLNTVFKPRNVTSSSQLSLSQIKQYIKLVNSGEMLKRRHQFQEKQQKEEIKQQNKQTKELKNELNNLSIKELRKVAHERFNVREAFANTLSKVELIRYIFTGETDPIHKKHKKELNIDNSVRTNNLMTTEQLDKISSIFEMHHNQVRRFSRQIFNSNIHDNTNITELRKLLVSRINPAVKYNERTHTIVPNIQVSTAMTDAFKTISFDFPAHEFVDLLTLETTIKQSITNLVRVETNTRNVKINLICGVMFDKVNTASESDEKPYTFSTKNEVFMRNESLQSIMNKINTFFSSMNTMIENHEGEGSGFRIVSINNLSLKIVKYEPKLLRGGKYFDLEKAGYKQLKGHRALLNIQNENDLCFLYCIIAHFNPSSASRKERVTNYHKAELMEKYNIEGINFPLQVKDINKFEQQNKGIYVNVFSMTKGENPKLEIVRINEQHAEDAVDILMLENNEDCHYVLIKDFSALKVGTDINKKNKTYRCKRCLNYEHRDEDKFKQHLEDCRKNSPTKTVMPFKNSFVQFSKYHNQLKQPYVIYADFEASLKSVNENDKDVPKGAYNKHIANSYAYYISCTHDNTQNRLKHEVNTKNKDKLLKNFINNIVKEATDINEKKHQIVEMNLTPEEEKYHKKTNICHICQQEITGKSIFRTSKKNKHPTKEIQTYKVRDHDHFTGKYRGPAHYNCNLRYKKVIQVPVYIHNLAGYDMHLFIKHIGKFTQENKDWKLDCIPNNEEKYMTISLKTTGIEIRFLDSFKVASTSLDELAKGLAPTDFKNIMSYFNISPDDSKFKILTKKGVYPYEWVNNDAKTKMKKRHLPDKEFFASKLYGTYKNNQLIKKEISDDEYNHAKLVWETMNCETFLDYHNLYLKLDVLLLADIMEKTRELLFNTYSLDIAHYFTLPQFANDAMYKLTKAKIQLMTDINMYNFIERGLYGGMSFTPNRYAKSDLETNEPTNDNKNTFMRYYDANALYSWAMLQSLPINNHKFETDMTKFTPEFILNHNNHVDTLEFQERYDAYTQTNNIFSDPSSEFITTEYIYEVDLEYPKHLHDLHNDYPLCPEHKQTTTNDYSPYQIDLINQLQIKEAKVDKLISSLNNKSKYIIHGRNLKQCLELGMKLTKVHRVVSFNQAPFMRTYINLNTILRAQANTKFEKDFFKLLNNAVFGKQMENVRNRINFELVSCKERLLKQVAKPNYKSTTIFDESLVGVHHYKNETKLDKPIFIGQAILGLSKWLMYNFHYNFIKRNFPTSKLIFTDTDSLTYAFTENYQQFNQIIKQNLDLFDNSDYPENHPLRNTNNKKIAGKFKDELNGSEMYEIATLRPKLYTYTSKEESKTTCKGIKKSEIKHLTMNDFKNTLFNKEIKDVKISNFVSNKHNIFTIEQTKTALSPFDTKRFWLNDGVTSYAYGHYNINK